MIKFTNKTQEEVAKVLFEVQWPGSVWGETKLEDHFRSTAKKVLDLLQQLEIEQELEELEDLE